MTLRFPLFFQKIFFNLKSRNRNPFRFLDVCSASIFHCNEAARWCFFVCSSEINIESNRIVDHYRTSRPRPVYNQTITIAGQLSIEYNQNIINGQLSIEYNLRPVLNKNIINGEWLMEYNQNTINRQCQWNIIRI